MKKMYNLLFLLISMFMISCNECEHKYTEWMLVKDSTCEEEGLRQKNASIVSMKQKKLYQKKSIHLLIKIMKNIIIKSVLVGKLKTWKSISMNG